MRREKLVETRSERLTELRLCSICRCPGEIELAIGAHLAFNTACGPERGLSLHHTSVSRTTTFRRVPAADRGRVIFCRVHLPLCFLRSGYGRGTFPLVCLFGQATSFTNE